MAIEKSLVSGSMTMLILKLLSEKDMYGYEMIDTLRQRSENVFELKAGTLYPLLHGLEEKGLLRVYEKEVSGKTRKYYSITKQGCSLLDQKAQEWEKICQGCWKCIRVMCFGGIADGKVFAGSVRTNPV